jgi:CBS domain-containing protein
MSDHDQLKNLDLITASEVMTPAPRTCSTYSSVLEAVMIFRDNDCGAVPILDAGKPIALLTDRDIALALAQYPDLATRPVSDITAAGVVSVEPGASLTEVCAKLSTQGVRRLLVVDPGGMVLGIISWADIAPVLSERTLGRMVKDTVAAPAGVA